ncbi:MAG TPA: O-methyltransferase [Bacteroidales bacterium]|nr:O-methyltransferase [Bacteroidales bacterium]HRZ77793.1 O-methyltransferase [Bacteroidales bacterium]
MIEFSELLLRYAEEHSSPGPARLAHIQRETWLKTAYPNMLSSPLQGGLLRMISRMLRPRNVVEIGTFTGYSSLCLALGLAEGGQVHTIERNSELEAMIRDHLEGYGLGEQIILHLGEALDVIPRLPLPFDLAFIDGDKPEYTAYYEALVPRMRPGGIILADNVLWGGKVADPQACDKDTLGIRAFNEHVRNDPRTQQLMLPLRDGLSVISVEVQLMGKH